MTLAAQRSACDVFGFNLVEATSHRSRRIEWTTDAVSLALIGAEDELRSRCQQSGVVGGDRPGFPKDEPDTEKVNC